MFERARYPTKEAPILKRKKLHVPAGQSVTIDSILTVAEAETSGVSESKKRKKDKKEIEKESKSKNPIKDNKEQSKYDIFSGDDEINDFSLTKKPEKTEDPKETKETDKTADVINNQTAMEDLRKDDFVVVELSSTKGKKIRYVANIVSTEPIQCSFLKENNNIKNTYIYPQIPDLGVIEFNEIIAVMPHPTTLRRGGYQFQNNIVMKYKLVDYQSEIYFISLFLKFAVFFAFE